MKKILLLALVCVMLTLTFTSCQVYNDVAYFVQNQLGNWGIITRTTITEEEWKDNWYSNNFTVVSTTSDGEVVEEILKTETTIKVYMSDQLIYFTAVDNVTYIIIEENGIWYAAELGGNYLSEYTLFEASEGEYFYIYDELEYDSNKRAYVWSDDEVKAEFKFENGRLVMGVFERISTGHTVTVSNVGTTVIEIPEYTIYDGSGGIGSPGATSPGR